MAEATSKIDFAKYRTPELFQAILDLIDFRGIYVKSAFRVLAGIILLGAIGGFAFWNHTGSLIIWSSVVFFSMFLGGFCAGAFAIAEVIRQSLGNMLKIVELLLEVTKTIAKDIAAVSDGETEMPTARELVEGVYCEVVLPLVEKAIADQLGCIGTPILFLYRLTLGRIMKIIIRMMPDRAFEGPEEGQTVDETGKKIMGTLQSVASHESQIVGILDWTQKNWSDWAVGSRSLS